MIPERPAFPNCKVLVVEDEPLIAMLIEDTLAELGCRLATASTFYEAASLIAAERFDAAFLDVNLAGKPCFPLAESLLMVGTPFTFMSGYLEAEIAKVFSNVAVLGKPFDEQRLVDALQQMLPAAEHPISENSNPD